MLPLFNGGSRRYLPPIGTPFLALIVAALVIITTIAAFSPVSGMASISSVGFDKLRGSATPPAVESEKPQVAAEQRPHNLCSLRVDKENEETVRRLKSKYSSLVEDKFTIAIQTYKRPKPLEKTINALTEEKIPSLHEIVVIWNEIDKTPPEDFERNGVPVRYLVSAKNSLNSRLRPHPSYATQAIFLSDDDVYYFADDLEFVFQAWREAGGDRLAGGLARCSLIDPKGDSPDTWKYDWCNRNPGEDNYSMVLTNLAMSHIAFMDQYSSDDPIATKIRGYVDEHTNCEDIAMNYIHSYLTRKGPLLVTGDRKYFNQNPAGGISQKKGHVAARAKCLNDFADFFGCMPLLNTTTHAVRGVFPIH